MEALVTGMENIRDWGCVSQGTRKRGLAAYRTDDTHRLPGSHAGAVEEEIEQVGSIQRSLVNQLSCVDSLSVNKRLGLSPGG